MGLVADFDEAAILFAAAMTVLFLVVYTLVAPWWRRSTGRGVVAFDAAVFLALLPSALHYLLGVNLVNAFFAWYYGCSLLSAGLITAWRTVVVVRVQRSSR